MWMGKNTLILNGMDEEIILNGMDEEIRN